VLHDEHARRTNYLSKGTRHGFPALQDHSTVIVGIEWPMTDPVRMSTHGREAPTLQHVRGAGLLPAWVSRRV
jgi:dTDP-4-dehydrorhamnose 3,5-epimerase